jgi:hypothetical protein
MNPCEELTELLRAVVRIRAILIEVVILRGIGPVGNLTSIIEDENRYRDVHELVGISHLSWITGTWNSQGERKQRVRLHIQQKIISIFTKKNSFFIFYFLRRTAN